VRWDTKEDIEEQITKKLEKFLARAGTINTKTILKQAEVVHDIKSQ